MKFGVAILFAMLLLTGQAFGNEWTKIDCAQSKVTTQQMTRCYVGPVSLGPKGNCRAERYMAYAVPDGKAAWARAYILESDQCWIGADADFEKTMKSATNLLRNKAVNWSAPITEAGLHGMTFDLPRRKCFAFYKYGPPHRLGYAYAIRGYVCGLVGKKDLSEADIASYVSSLKVTP